MRRPQRRRLKTERICECEYLVGTQRGRRAPGYGGSEILMKGKEGGLAGLHGPCLPPWTRTSKGPGPDLGRNDS